VGRDARGSNIVEFVIKVLGCKNIVQASNPFVPRTLFSAVRCAARGPKMISSDAPSLPMHILERTPGGARMHVHTSETMLSDHPLGNLKTASTLFSRDGRLLACLGSEDVRIYDTGSNTVLRSLPLPGAVAMHFSPEGTFIEIYQKANASGAGEEKNLSVWNVTTGEKVYACFQKSFNSLSWPYLQFSADDKVACRAVSNEVHFFDTDKFDESAARLKVPQVALAKLSPGADPSVATFVPEKKGIPGSVCIYSPPPTGTEGVIELQPTARKAFFRVNEVDFMWAPDGKAVLVLGSCDVDVTNQSYYGETSLVYMRADGQIDCKVPLDKEGPVHEAKWSPTSEEFVVVYGYMPAKATIFCGKKCEPKYQLGAGPHNTVRWNPFGRFILLAGFGNLPGDMKFFDRKQDGKYKLVGATRAACAVTAEWSPDGRRLLTATIAPRLNVDNGFKIWRYNGDLLHHEQREKLYEASWAPAPNGTHADRPISAGSVRKETDERLAPDGTAAPKKAGAYKPPHATSGSGNFSLAIAKAEDAGPGKYKAPGSGGGSGNSGNAKTPSGPPGATFVEGGGMSASAKKNAKKRAASKAKAEGN
jgi:translation initiation factor 2A